MRNVATMSIEDALQLHFRRVRNLRQDDDWTQPERKPEPAVTEEPRSIRSTGRSRFPARSGHDVVRAARMALEWRLFEIRRRLAG